MVAFIVRQIENKAKISLEEGQELYRKYFINTKLYAGYKAGVDAQLIEDGYEDVIVKK